MSKVKCPNCKKSFDIDDSKRYKRKFCSNSCSNKRVHSDETKKKISLKLSNRNINQLRYDNRICLNCKNKINKRNKSGYCKKCVKSTDFFRSKLRKPKSNSENMGGLREGGGRSKVLEYVSNTAGKILLNKHEIKIAKALDLLNIKWNRNYKGFEYTDKRGKKRKFHPDFYIEDFDLYIEYKGWVTSEINHKMNDAVKNNNFKLLIIYSNDKRYKKLGLSMDEVVKNPNIILEYV